MLPTTARANTQPARKAGPLLLARLSEEHQDDSDICHETDVDVDGLGQNIANDISHDLYLPSSVFFRLALEISPSRAVNLPELIPPNPTP